MIVKRIKFGVLGSGSFGNYLVLIIIYNYEEMQ